MSYSFVEQLGDDRQDVACKAVADFWCSQGYEVWDVSKNPSYFSDGVDLIRTINGNERTAIDVKCDFKAHLTGNIPVEFIEVVRKDDNSIKLGWAHKESLDEIHFYIWETKQILAIKRKTLLDLAFQDGRKGFAAFHEKPFPYFTFGILIPITDL
jgi:hypothetical protein